jgi:transcriptional regulator with XRE-family HTH domain
MSISETLKAARADSGLTQEAVAEKAGVSRQTVYNWENGKSYPDIANIIALSDVYGVTLDSLVKGDKAMIKHLEESSGVGGNAKYVVVSIVALVVFLACIWLAITAIGGDARFFLDFPTLLFLLIPLRYVLTVTRGFRLFCIGLRAAVMPKRVISEEQRQQAASLFRLMTKTVALSSILFMIIGFISLGVAFNWHNFESLEMLDVEFMNHLTNLFLNFSVNMILPFYALILILVVFEPVVFILKKK